MIDRLPEHETKRKVIGNNDILETQTPVILKYAILNIAIFEVIEFIFGVLARHQLRAMDFCRKGWGERLCSQILIGQSNFSLFLFSCYFW